MNWKLKTEIKMGYRDTWPILHSQVYGITLTPCVKLHFQLQKCKTIEGNKYTFSFFEAGAQQSGLNGWLHEWVDRWAGRWWVGGWKIIRPCFYNSISRSLKCLRTPRRIGRQGSCLNPWFLSSFSFIYYILTFEYDFIWNFFFNIAKIQNKFESH